jgi:hypothetical protein
MVEAVITASIIVWPSLTLAEILGNPRNIKVIIHRVSIMFWGVATDTRMRQQSELMEMQYTKKYRIQVHMSAQIQ